MKIDDLLKTAMQCGASDVHLAVPAYPPFRVQDEIIPAGHVCAKGVESTVKAR
jgi:Tfp pilus assembly pilus retraction ATPase PilT